MRELGTINSVLQQQVWQDKAVENLQKLNNGLIDRRLGVYGDKDFHEIDIKWFPSVM